jgi:hypothetical protein
MGRREKQADAKVRGQSVLVTGPHFEAKTTTNRCFKDNLSMGVLNSFSWFRDRILGPKNDDQVLL